MVYLFYSEEKTALGGSCVSSGGFMLLTRGFLRDVVSPVIELQYARWVLTMASFLIWSRKALNCAPLTCIFISSFLGHFHGPRGGCQNETQNQVPCVVGSWSRERPEISCTVLYACHETRVSIFLPCTGRIREYGQFNRLIVQRRCSNQRQALL